jgi:hypothetical protein
VISRATSGGGRGYERSCKRRRSHATGNSRDATRPPRHGQHGCAAVAASERVADDRTPGRRLVPEGDPQVRVDHDVEAVAQLVEAHFVLVGGLAHQRPGEALVLNVEADLIIWPVGP